MSLESVTDDEDQDFEPVAIQPSTDSTNITSSKEDEKIDKISKRKKNTKKKTLNVKLQKGEYYKRMELLSLA